jgi:hypothetical protein
MYILYGLKIFSCLIINSTRNGYLEKVLVAEGTRGNRNSCSRGRDSSTPLGIAVP